MNDETKSNLAVYKTYGEAFLHLATESDSREEFVNGGWCAGKITWRPEGWVIIYPRPQQPSM